MQLVLYKTTKEIIKLHWIDHEEGITCTMLILSHFVLNTNNFYYLIDSDMSVNNSIKMNGFMLSRNYLLFY